MAKMNWNNLIGHQETLTLLKTIVSSNKAAHAYLFKGPRGVGKMLAARIFAAALLCEAQKEKPCGLCRSCALIERESHPDFTVIRSEGGGAKETIKIEQIRSLKHFALLAPALARGRVCVIEDAQRMTAEAANSLLKLLEEAPPDFYFILTAAPEQPLLATIVSRCLEINFAPLAKEVLAQYLMEKHGLDFTLAQTAANLSGGRLGGALKFLEPEGFALRNQAALYLAELSAAPFSMTSEFWTELTSLSQQDILTVLEYAAILLRDTLVTLINVDKNRGKDMLFNPDSQDKIFPLLKDWDEKRILAAEKHLKEARRAIAGNAAAKLTLEALTIKLKA